MMTVINVFIVDDAPRKRAKINDAVRDALGETNVNLVEAGSSAEAARRLENLQVDLLILDLHLPIRADAEPTSDAGYQLLKKISQGGPRFQRPAYILGITGFGDVFQKYRQAFVDEGWQLVQFDETSNEWTKSVTSLSLHIASIQASKAGRYGHDLGIITALQLIELEAVLRLDAKWTETRMPGDDTIYHVGFFQRENRRLSVVAAAATEMGMPASACLAMKMIGQFRPRWLGMAGIAAGVGLNLGDIIVAEQSWDYGSGKLYGKGKKSIFSPAPSYIALEQGLKEQFAIFIARRKAIISQIQNAWSGNPVETALKARLGPMASGAAVVENERIITAIKALNRKVIGIEMETYGLFSAARVATQPQPKAFSCKSVCDFGKPPKTDDFQRYAAFTSAAFIYEFGLDQLAVER